MGGGSISNYENKSPILIAWDDMVTICMLVQLEVEFFFTLFINRSICLILFLRDIIIFALPCSGGG